MTGANSPEESTSADSSNDPSISDMTTAGSESRTNVADQVSARAAGPSVPTTAETPSKGAFADNSNGPSLPTFGDHGKPFSHVRDILNDPVSRHMRPASTLVRLDQTISAALDSIRSTQDAGRIIYFYVVDDDLRLKGVVTTRKLLLSSPETTIREVMSPHTIAIPVTASVLDACEFFTMHKLLAFPVTDADQKVVGIVDVDLYTEELSEIERRQESDDLFQLIGVHLSEATQGNARLAFFGRFPWLLCNVFGGMLSALIADAYDDVSTLVVVAPFIALVTALAESVSIQSVSLALQALHSQPPKWATFVRLIGMELLVGLLLGVACGLTVGAVAWLWKGNFIVAASLFLGIVGGVVTSAGVGLSIPYVLRLCRRDPQLASGPIALALSDVVTLLCYFNLGRWLLT